MSGQLLTERHYGVRGEVCATNGGSRTTENLKIVDQVQYKSGSGQFQNLFGASQAITSQQQLGPGESKCYPYEIEFEPVEGASIAMRPRLLSPTTLAT